MCSLLTKPLNQHYHYSICRFLPSFIYFHPPLFSSSSSSSPPPALRSSFSIGNWAGAATSVPSTTLMEVVKSVYNQGGERIAIRADHKSFSYAQLVSSASEISTLLCGAGLKPIDGARGNGPLAGARIGIVAKPCVEFVAGVLATWFSGGVAVPLAVSYPETELLHVMNDSGISMVLSTEDYHEVMEKVASKCAAQFSLLPSVANISSETSAYDQKIFGGIDALKGDDPALIIYTSGTTGKPKGALHTHNSVNSQVQILAEAWEYTSNDQFLHCLPLHHVHGLFNALFAPLYAGSTVEFMPKFSVKGAWQRWRESYPESGTKSKDAITAFTGDLSSGKMIGKARLRDGLYYLDMVPTMYTWLIQGYESMDTDLQAASAYAARQLRLMMCGSSALPVPVLQRWETITGHRLLERYGMTEFVMAISNPLKGTRKAGTVGKPLPRVQVKLVQDENDNDDTGVGQICVKSPSLFKEYWKLPQVTKESFTDDGFFKTGDAGKIDEDGYYVILGRTSADIMKVGGYKLSALEIESILLEHPSVRECCVLGLPDKDFGEAVSAIIVLTEECNKEPKGAITLEGLREWAKDKLAPYKLPTKLFLWDSLPRNAMGKVNKKELKKVLSPE
ncbi:Probable CoA ligase CCL8 [Linum perenne]